MISDQSIKQQASIKQNQSFPWTKLLHDLWAINKTTSNLPRICMKCVTRNRDEEPCREFHTDALRKANHKSGGKSSTIGCHKVTSEGAEQKNKIWRFRHSSYTVLLFNKSRAEARCLNQSFEFGSAERLSLLLDLILREQLSWTVVCIIYGCQRSASWRHVYKHTFCIQTYILDWTSPLGLFRNNNKGDKIVWC